jgi:hypothetical protein
MRRPWVGRAVPGVPKELTARPNWFRFVSAGRVERSCGVLGTGRPTKMLRPWVGRAVLSVPKDLVARPNSFRFAATG